MKNQGLIKRSATFVLAAGLAAGTLTACEDEDDNGEEQQNVEAPATYEFESSFNEGESSVSYGGQIYRHSLINDLTGRIEGLDDDIIADLFEDTSEEAIRDRLLFYYENDEGQTASNSLPYSLDPPALQEVYSDLASGRDLAAKIAGSSGEESTQYVDDWTEAFAGWDPTVFAPEDGSVDSPDALVKALIAKIAENGSGFADTEERSDPTGSSDDPLPSYVTTEGQDLAQLVEKFLRGAVAYSQGTDDYLDDDVDGKGLLADNTGPDGSDNYSALEHQWDEGFGYFGAARDYLDYTDAEIAGKAEDSERNVYFDTNSDEAIDLNAEYNFGHSTNAAKRDLGSADSDAPTDYTQQAYEGFARGREIIRQAQLDGDGELTDAEFADLVEARDEAILAWEHALAATAVHYINDTLADMDNFGTDDYSFLDHAKHWSELKGFALILQFNPRARIHGEDFETLHERIGMKPVLPTAEQSEIDAYRTALGDARQLLQDAYGFTDSQVANW
jgi:hypothetical protein